MSDIVIYEDGNVELKATVEDESVWLSQKQMAELFGKSKKTISEHIGNIFKEGELDRQAVVRNFRTTASDGNMYDVIYHSLDVIVIVRAGQPQGIAPTCNDEKPVGVPLVGTQTNNRKTTLFNSNCVGVPLVGTQMWTNNIKTNNEIVLDNFNGFINSNKGQPQGIAPTGTHQYGFTYE